MGYSKRVSFTFFVCHVCKCENKNWIINGIKGIDAGMVKILLLLYADDIVLFGKTPDELQKSLDILEAYCDRWNLTVNIAKTKVVVFQKGGRLPAQLQFTFKGSNIEIVNKFWYLGIVFTSGGSSFETQKNFQVKR